MLESREWMKTYSSRSETATRSRCWYFSSRISCSSCHLRSPCAGLVPDCRYVQNRPWIWQILSIYWLLDCTAERSGGQLGCGHARHGLCEWLESHRGLQDANWDIRGRILAMLYVPTELLVYALWSSKTVRVFSDISLDKRDFRWWMMC